MWPSCTEAVYTLVKVPLWGSSVRVAIKYHSSLVVAPPSALGIALTAPS